jgi:hypothetical protein
MEVSGQLHEPAAFLRNRPPTMYPLIARLSGHHSRYGRFGEQKNPMPLPIIVSSFKYVHTQTYLNALLHKPLT